MPFLSFDNATVRYCLFWPATAATAVVARCIVSRGETNETPRKRRAHYRTKPPCPGVHTLTATQQYWQNAR